MTFHARDYTYDSVDGQFADYVDQVWNGFDNHGEDDVVGNSSGAAILEDDILVMLISVGSQSLAYCSGVTGYNGLEWQRYYWKWGDEAFNRNEGNDVVLDTEVWVARATQTIPSSSSGASSKMAKAPLTGVAQAVTADIIRIRGVDPDLVAGNDFSRLLGKPYEFFGNLTSNDQLPQVQFSNPLNEYILFGSGMVDSDPHGLLDVETGWFDKVNSWSYLFDSVGAVTYVWGSMKVTANSGTNEFTFTSTDDSPNYDTSDIYVTLHTDGTMPGGVEEGKRYLVRSYTNTTNDRFSLWDDPELSNDVLDITSAGSGNLYVRAIPVARINFAGYAADTSDPWEWDDIRLTAFELGPHSAPGNDDFDEAYELTCNATRNHDTLVGSTVQSGEPDHGEYANDFTVWYKWTATEDEEATVEAFVDAGPSNEFATAVGVYTGDAVNSLVEVASGTEDFFDDTHPVKVSWSATEGETYHIAVSGYAVGDVSITLTCEGWDVLASVPSDQKPEIGIPSGLPVAVLPDESPSDDGDGYSHDKHQHGLDTEGWSPHFDSQLYLDDEEYVASFRTSFSPLFPSRDDYTALRISTDESAQGAGLTVTQNVDALQTSFTVTWTVPSSSSNDVIKVGSEYMLVKSYTPAGGGSNKTITVVRGILGSTATTHTSGESGTNTGRYWFGNLYAPISRTATTIKVRETEAPLSNQELNFIIQIDSEQLRVTGRTLLEYGPNPDPTDTDPDPAYNDFPIYQYTVTRAVNSTTAVQHGWTYVDSYYPGAPSATSAEGEFDEGPFTQRTFAETPVFGTEERILYGLSGGEDGRVVTLRNDNYQTRKIPITLKHNGSVPTFGQAFILPNATDIVLAEAEAVVFRHDGSFWRLIADARHYDATGLPGMDGKDGSAGTAGATGATGPAGIDGVDGVPGVAGATGPTGPIGLPGIDGSDGPPGEGSGSRAFGYFMGS